jgi:hypothetical protein
MTGESVKNIDAACAWVSRVILGPAETFVPPLDMRYADTSHKISAADIAARQRIVSELGLLLSGVHAARDPVCSGLVDNGLRLPLQDALNKAKSWLRGSPDSYAVMFAVRRDPLHFLQLLMDLNAAINLNGGGRSGVTAGAPQAASGVSGDLRAMQLLPRCASHIPGYFSHRHAGTDPNCGPAFQALAPSSGSWVSL